MKDKDLTVMALYRSFIAEERWKEAMALVALCPDLEENWERFEEERPPVPTYHGTSIFIKGLEYHYSLQTREDVVQWLCYVTIGAHADFSVIGRKVRAKLGFSGGPHKDALDAFLELLSSKDTISLRILIASLSTDIRSVMVSHTFLSPAVHHTLESMRELVTTRKD